MTEDELTQACWHLQEGEKCARPLLTNCEHNFRIDFTGQLDANDYLCGTGKEVYLANQECLANQEMLINIKHCTHDIEHYDRALSYKQICNMLEHDLDCVRTLVHRECKEDAADFQYNYERILLKPLQDYINCHLPTDEPDNKTGNNHQTWVIVGITVAIFVVLCIIGGMVGVVIYHNLKRRNSSRSGGDHTNSAPPAYSADGSVGVENPMYGSPNAAVVYPGAPVDQGAVGNTPTAYFSNVQEKTPGTEPVDYDYAAAGVFLNNLPPKE